MSTVKCKIPVISTHVQWRWDDAIQLKQLIENKINRRSTVGTVILLPLQLVFSGQTYAKCCPPLLVPNFGAVVNGTRRTAPRRLRRPRRRSKRQKRRHERAEESTSSRSSSSASTSSSATALHVALK